MPSNNRALPAVGVILRYNLPMRMLILTIAVALLLPAGALAAGDGPAAPDSIRIAADDCCLVFTTACVELKFRPRCDWLAHLCAVPYYPCERRVCIDAPCHQPLMTCEPCDRCVCIDAPCHRPVVTAYPCDPCPVTPVLTGSRELIAAPCECECSTGDCGCQTEDCCGEDNG